MQLSIIVPTFNEAPNVTQLVQRAGIAMQGIDAEIVFVDDSTDATPDTIREVDEAGSHVIDRARLRGVQTPQGFRRSIIEAAHAVLSDTGTPVTDDAAAVEYTGHEVTLVAGDRLAFKVTEPLDVALAVAVAGGAA